MAKTKPYKTELECLFKIYEETSSYFEFRINVDLHGIELTDKIVEMFIKHICHLIIFKETYDIEIQRKAISFMIDYIQDSEMFDGNDIVDYVISNICSYVITNENNEIMSLFRKLLEIKPIHTVKEYKRQKIFSKYSC